jgi:hypothetical protein
MLTQLNFRSASAVARSAESTPTRAASSVAPTARAGNRRFGLLSALHAHTKLPHKTDLLWRTLRPIKRPERAQTGQQLVRESDGLGLRLIFPAELPTADLSSGQGATADLFQC